MSEEVARLLHNAVVVVACVVFAICLNSWWLVWFALLFCSYRDYKEE
jgi:predicted secreted protein